MLKLYDYLDNIVAENDHFQRLYEANLSYFASEVLESLNIEDNEEMNSSIQRAIAACNQLHFSFSKNFMPVYRFNGEELIKDWKLSPLACYLIIINSSPSHENVAKAQLYFVTKKR